MRGGRFQQKGSEDANARNAETLFETRSVGTIREVEGQTRREIEEKKEELRQLVGASYRDLIESADSILLMRQSCEAVADNVRKMEQGFESLKTSITLSTVSSESDNERRRRESLFGLGSRVKYLVDTPEKIWGCLDEHMYLEGSERYLRANEVHSLLTATTAESNELFATFPLLRHQWPLVETFRGQISQRSKDRLQEPGLKVGEYAIALAAVGIMDELPAPQIFSLFLDIKRVWLKNHLRMANAGLERVLREKEVNKLERTVNSPADYASIAATLCRLGHMIQASLCHVGELFLEVSGNMPLLFSTVLKAPPGSQLFGGIPNPEREVRLWKSHREKLEMSMVAWSGKSITDSCLVWLHKCAEEISLEGRALLQHVKSGKELAEVERIVREDLAKQLALGPSLQWLKTAFGSAFDSPWDCLCELLLKEPTSLWEVLFENMFVTRMKEVVDSGFRGITIDGPLDGILSSSGIFERSQKSRLEEKQLKGIGRYLGGENVKPLSGLEGCGSVWQAMQDETDSCSAVFSPEVTKLKDTVDEGLRIVLEDCLSFLQGPQSSSRTEELAEYLQEQCRLCIATIINVLKDRLFHLTESMTKITDSSRQQSSTGNESNSGNSLQASKIVEKALFLGRLSTALGQHSSYMPIILGSPAQWSAQVQSVSLRGPLWLGSRASLVPRDQAVSNSYDRWYTKTGKAGNSGNADGSLKLRELQRTLRRQSIAAHEIWVVWSTEGLAVSFYRDLQNDDCLSTSTPLKGWEETVLKQEEESGGEVEMKLALPAMPSSYAASFVYAGCQEIYRVGGHVLDIAVLRSFARKLCEKALSVYDKFLSEPSTLNTRVSEKGLLQLLFDLRFLADVLSGGQNVKEDLDDKDDVKDASLSVGNRRDFSVDTSIPASKEWVASLLAKVLSKLDPIDWATYEPHLWNNECRYYQRCAVLYGSLIQLNRLYTDTLVKPLANADTNTLNTSGTVPRFTTYLIGGPSSLVSGGLGLRVSRVSLQDDPVSSLWSGYANGDDIYQNGSSDLLRNESSGAGLVKSLMGQVGSLRFSDGLKLGLLSDTQVERFKDKSAAAISTFGDMLPMQAAGLFSSLTAGSMKES